MYISSVTVSFEQALTNHFSYCVTLKTHWKCFRFSEVFCKMVNLKTKLKIDKTTKMLCQSFCATIIFLLNILEWEIFSINTGGEWIDRPNRPSCAHSPKKNAGNSAISGGRRRGWPWKAIHAFRAAVLFLVTNEALFLDFGCGFFHASIEYRVY